MKKATIVLFALALLGWWFSEPCKINLSAGAFAPDEPRQTSIKVSLEFDFTGYQITPLTNFDLDAKCSLKSAIDSTVEPIYRLMI